MLFDVLFTCAYCLRHIAHAKQIPDARRKEDAGQEDGTHIDAGLELVQESSAARPNAPGTSVSEKLFVFFALIVPKRA